MTICREDSLGVVIFDVELFFLSFRLGALTNHGTADPHQVGPTFDGDLEVIAHPH